MELRYQLTVADYVEGQRAYASKTVWFRLYLWAAVITVLLALCTVMFVDVLRAVPLLLLVGLWLLPRLLLPWWARRDFRKHPSLSREYLFRVDGDGVQMTSDVGYGGGKWAAYTEFRETPNLVLLFCGARMFFTIPKRLFSGTQLQEFRKLLIHNLPAK